MRTRIGAALMIAVATILMGGQLGALVQHDTFRVDYTIATADGSLIPLVVD